MGSGSITVLEDGRDHQTFLCSISTVQSVREEEGVDPPLTKTYLSLHWGCIQLVAALMWRGQPWNIFEKQACESLPPILLMERGCCILEADFGMGALGGSGGAWKPGCGADDEGVCTSLLGGRIGAWLKLARGVPWAAMLACNCCCIVVMVFGST